MLTKNRAQQFTDWFNTHMGHTPQLKLAYYAIMDLNQQLNTSNEQMCIDIGQLQNNLNGKPKKRTSGERWVISTEQEINEGKSLAVMEFVNTQVGAFAANFVEGNQTSLYSMYRFAQHHVRDNYRAETKMMSEVWGEELTECARNKGERQSSTCSGSDEQADATNNQINEVIERLRGAIQDAEQFGLVRTEADCVITGAIESEHGIILTSGNE
jgi:hypothetical protein